MYRINTDEQARLVINEELKVVRATDKELARELRKVFNAIKDLYFDEEPLNAQDIFSYVEVEFVSLNSIEMLFDSLNFIEEITNQETANSVEEIKFSIDIQDYSNMNTLELQNVLFSMLDSETKASTIAMSTGLKVGLDLLDELKAELVMTYPDIRTELLTAKIADALAYTKEVHGSSLKIIDGSLAVYDFIGVDTSIDSKDFKFLADINADKTMCLDTLILKSAWASLKVEVALGTIAIPSTDLVLAVTKAIKGVKETSTSTKAKLKGLKF